MSFELSEEALELKRTLRKLFSEELPLEKLVAISDEPYSDFKQLREEFRQLGIAEFLSEDTQGEQTFSILGQVAYEAGRALCPLPLVDELFAKVYLAPHAEGKTNLSSEGLRVAPCSGVATERVEVKREGDALLLSGEVHGVARGHKAEELFLLLPEYGVALLDRSPGEELPLVQETRAPLDLIQPRNSYRFEHTRFLLLSSAEANEMRARLFTLVAQELCGVCDRAMELTVEYVKTRKQFGVSVGGFQAVQHRAADMKLRLEQMESLAQFANWALENDPSQGEFSSFAAISFCCEHAPWIVESAIQLHGGIGFTWEYGLHLFLRRAQALSLLYSMKSKEVACFLELAGRQAGVID